MVSRKKKAADKQRMAENSQEEETKYAIENEQHNTTNMTWDTGHTENNNKEKRRM